MTFDVLITHNHQNYRLTLTRSTASTSRRYQWTAIEWRCRFPELGHTGTTVEEAIARWITFNTA